MKETIRSEFKSYIKASYSGSMSVDQFHCLEEAFYGGSRSMLAMMGKASSDLTELEAIQKMKDLDDELAEWVLKYKKKHGIPDDKEI